MTVGTLSLKQQQQLENKWLDLLLFVTHNSGKTMLLFSALLLLCNVNITVYTIMTFMPVTKCIISNLTDPALRLTEEIVADTVVCCTLGLNIYF